MLQVQTPTANMSAASPLILCDRLISLAQEADRAGHIETATHLIELAYSVFDEKKPRAHA